MATELQLKIPSELVEKIEQRINGTEFKDAESYILYLIRDALGESEYFTVEDEKEIKRRLGALGYE